MKMKTAAIVLATLFFSQANSQLYVEVGGGYGLAAAANGYTMQNSSTSFQTGSTSTMAAKSGISYGKGAQAFVVIGTMFNANVGAELGVSYLAGAKFKSTSTDTSDVGIDKRISTSSGTMLRLTPALRLTAGKGNVKPYLKAGVVIGVSPKLKNQLDFPLGSGGAGNAEAETTGGISIGFSGGAGATFRLSNKLSFFSEVSIITQSWSPKKGVVTKYVSNGVDQLPTLTVSDKETEFVSSLTSTYSPGIYPYDTTTPSKTLKTLLPFSSVGLNVGLHIGFGRKGK